MSNFAPYQSDTPEHVRALSPSPPPSTNHNRIASPRRSLSSSPQPGRNRNPDSAARQPRNISEVLPSPGQYADGANDSYQNGSGQYFDDPAAAEEGRVTGEEEEASGFGGGGSGIGGVGRGWNGRDVDVFETSLPLRMDYEACVPYLLLPPAGGVLILLLEHKSDYVRFHAWQSSLLFTVIFVIHLVFSFSAIVSWMLFACDLLLIGWLSFRAYRDAETLDRCQVPFFGPLASSILDDE
ncbi:hypothetical protein EV356DRAFT_54041 [Viridothelium virens]|uniref:Uncharacterized protein n=1 Tax=Viridothelium virens TaxID=1048519 RepID=A0A6A6HFN3_VIRVR|nr:hypothetical protein EV356DRAFT_54041 [Viridothelium virens]